ncbi:MAG: serine hydrolase [bacterium]
MNRRLIPVIFILFSTAFNAISQTKNATQLTPNKPVLREIQASETHSYKIKLKPRQFLYGRIEQMGIDVVAKLFDPEGRKIDEVDAPTGDRGSENILLVTEQAGEYRIEIQAFDPLAKRGKYRVKIERLEDAAKTPSARIDQMFAPWDTKDTPGAAIAVVKDGKIIYAKGYGSANLEYDIPITPSTVFHIASVSKQFTAFAIAMLVQQGKLSLDDDIRKYLPEVPDFGKKITIRHLVHHTSGLRDQWNLLVMAGWRMDDVITKEHILKLVSHQKELNFAPGAEYLYCNTGYTLLAEIVARVSGKSFAEWTQENIFQPLGIQNTLFYDDHEKIVKNRAYSYSLGRDGGFKKSVLSYANVGATSLFTTVGDLGKWAMNFENPKVGNREIFAQMEERGVLNKGDTLNYAFGQGIGKYKGLRRISHGGADAGYRTYLGRFPGQKFAVIVFSNLGSFNPGGMALKIADIYLADVLIAETPKVKVQAKPEIKRAEVDPALYEEYAGKYQVHFGVVATISRAGNRLMARVTGQASLELIPVSETRFVSEDGSTMVLFQRDSLNKVHQMTVHRDGLGSVAPRIKPFTLRPQEMAAFAGEYYSEELRTSYAIIVQDSALVAQHRRHSDFTLTPQSQDIFSGSAWFFNRVRFVRDAENRITGLRVSNGRVRNLLFARK